MFLLMRIGCIECGVSSDVVGVFGNQVEADSVAETLNNNKEACWIQSGQNSYEVFEIPVGTFVSESYEQYLKGSPDE